jgi:hypothetical protein
MKLVVVVTLVALVSGARADDDPFAMLRERERAWTFELVTGPSIGALAPVQGAPLARCRVVALAAIGTVARSRIECTALAEATGEVAAALAQHFTLAFEPTGVRETVIESDEPAVLAAKTNAGAFTFPRKLAHTWSYEGERPDGAHAMITAHAEPAVVRGTPGTWWITEASYRGATRQGVVAEPVRAAAAFAPGVGPALKCTVGREPGATRYMCLRLVADPAPPTVAPIAKPRPRPVATVAITGKTAHNKSSLSAAAVAGKIAASYVPAIRRCYGELLRKKPSAGGALQLDFTVNAVGKLSEPAAKTAEAALDAVARCVHGAMAAWQFAIPQSEYGEPRTARFVIDLRLAPPAL